MLSAESKSFLIQLLDAPGPSGFEVAPARIWREEAQRFAEVDHDTSGNSFATVRGTADGPAIMLAGHIDEIGLIVTWIDDQGFLYVSAVGGWDSQVLVGQRLRIIGRNGDVIGLVGKKPIHIMKNEERERASKLTDLWIDIGATSKAEAEQMVSVGDAAVIDARVVELPNERLASRAIDDRIGAFIVLEALRRYAASPGAATVTAVATSQEEIGYHGGGAKVAAHRIDPVMAVAVDVTFATDHPGIERKEHGDHRVGGGPVLTRGAIISPVVFALLRDTATDRQIPYTVHAKGRETSTDADFIHLSRTGVATGLVSVPNRYMHSPNEMVALSDLDHAAELIAEVCRRVDSAMDFRRG